MLNRLILEDDCGQGAAEYILLFGGVIVIAIIVLLIYKSYFHEGSHFRENEDLDTVRKCASTGKI